MFCITLVQCGKNMVPKFFVAIDVWIMIVRIRCPIISVVYSHNVYCLFLTSHEPHISRIFSIYCQFLLAPLIFLVHISSAIEPISVILIREVSLIVQPNYWQCYCIEVLGHWCLNDTSVFFPFLSGCVLFCFWSIFFL